ncbi:LysE/ArgO family amino acid transporter [Micromonospora sp. NPDC049523]|uniref:LysE/ArgO family amino acid transporter n=1 Tax=Micromonospora sp. NPDC049523 TaxID=3155921 RepID=UPI00343C8579
MLTSTLAGFTASIALIAAIGAQNAFVLRQGLRRQHVLAVVLTCAVSDALLIAVGIAGLGAVIADQPLVAGTIRWVGAAFLLCYALFAARRALRPGRLTPTDREPVALRTTIAMCLAFTYLNPHVYLDTVLLLGSVANQHDNRWLFGSGAVLASAVWFTALGFGAHRLAPALSRPNAWRILDALVATLMTALALSLLHP